jgi:hypothetical protein
MDRERMVFRFVPGSALPPVGGQNEYLGCLTAVLNLRSAGKREERE